jgi:hypothetical protein
MSAALLARLIEAGTPAELVGEVAMELAKAQAVADILEQRKAKDRERKRLPRTSAESEETAEIQEQGFPEVSPPAPPLPNPSNTAPLSPPIQEEKLRAVGSCLKKAYQAEIPDWMPESFAEFRAMRKRMRNVPFEPGAERRCIAKLTRLRSEGHDPEKLLSKAIENGHRTFFPDETTKADRKATPEQVRENQLGLAALYDRMGRTEEADEIRRRYAASIGDVAGAIVKSVRAA